MTTEANGRLGEVLREGDQVGARYERLLAHPPAKVWRALTESDHLRHWFPADMIGERREGAEVRFRFWPETADRVSAELAEMEIDSEEPELPGRILTWDPPHVFEVLWDDECLRFELTADGAGTRLLCTVRFGTRNPHGIEGTAAGYHVCLDGLVQALEGTAAGVPDPDAVATLQRRYAEALETAAR